MSVEANSRRADDSHALCLTLFEVILFAVVIPLGVSFAIVYEVMFGTTSPGRVFSIAVDALQGSLFWSTVLVGLWRLAKGAYRRLHGAGARH